MVPHSSFAKLVYKYNNEGLWGLYINVIQCISIVNGEYKPTYIGRAPPWNAGPVSMSDGR